MSKMNNEKENMNISGDGESRTSSRSASSTCHSKNPTPKKSRYDMFTSILHKSVKGSHEAVDTIKAKLIADCYGDNASLFGDTKAEGTDVLVGLLERVLEQIDDELNSEISNVLEREGAKLKLDRFDAAIDSVNDRERRIKEADEYDKQSVNDAVENTKMPKGISMNDVMAYRIFLLKKQERDELLTKIKAEEDDVAMLEEKLKKQVENFESDVNQMNETGKALKETADLCAA